MAALVGSPTGSERVDVLRALGRVAAERVASPEALPAFPRSTMDGFAVRAAETYGASDAAPAYLRLAGEVLMGSVARERLEPGTARRVHTGAMLPPLADAVVILEDTNLRGEELEVLRAVAPGDNALAAGEDVAAGEVIVEAGRELRAQDLGALHAAGVTRVAVRRRPVVGILSSGDEVVAPGAGDVPLGTVRDVNAVTIGATVERAGGEPRYFGIVPDDEAALFAAAKSALAACDALVLSAGSSVSARDLTSRAIERLGPPGILVHGIALRPGKPTILAMADGKPVIGLPGNPVSALVVAWRMLRPLVRLLLGAPVAADGLGEERTLDVRLAATVPSRPGREDYVPVTLSRGDAGWEATPVFGKSSLIFTLVRSDGLLFVPLDLAGYAAGSRARGILP